jgi:uncharacterized damage-inducible protein DinB
MGSRAEADADEFERVTDQLVDLCESISEEQWDARCSGEGWSIGGVAHHVAEANRLLVERLSLPLGTVTDDEMAVINARDARSLPNPDREETVLVLREVADQALAQIRESDDDRLARRLTQHTRGHLESIQKALASEAS